MSDKIIIDALFPNNIRIAHIQKNELQNINFEVAGSNNVRGNIYLAKVIRVENSLQSAFVDYGGEKNGFLSISEIHPDYFHIPLEEKQKLIKNIEELEDDKEEEGKELPTKELGRLYKSYNISSVIKVGQIVLVKVIKEERGNKGATLTTYISLAGRYCVYMANTPKRNGISRKIHNIGERQRIRDIISEMHNEKQGSVVVRTVGNGASKESIEKDYMFLSKTWADIKKKTLSAQAPALIHEDGSIAKQLIREYCTEHTDEIVVEGNAMFSEVEEILQNPAYKNLKLTKYNSRTPIFSSFNIEDSIANLLKPVVSLPSGASLVIQQTEALVSIDVNSGRSTGEISVEETALKTNKEAVWEIAKQLRLRNLSGLIVVDFIDMNQFSNRRIIEKEFKAALEKDRVKVQILSISAFGLMEISRQRTSPSLLEIAGNHCSVCSGSGFTQSVEYASMAAIRQIGNFINKNTRSVIKKIQVDAKADVCIHLLNYKSHLLRGLETENNVKIIFNISQSDDIKILDISKDLNDDTIFVSKKDSDEIKQEPQNNNTHIKNKNKQKQKNKKPQKEIIPQKKTGLLSKILKKITKKS